MIMLEEGFLRSWGIILIISGIYISLKYKSSHDEEINYLVIFYLGLLDVLLILIDQNQIIKLFLVLPYRGILF